MLGSVTRSLLNVEKRDGIVLVTLQDGSFSVVYFSSYACHHRH